MIHRPRTWTTFVLVLPFILLGCRPAVESREHPRLVVLIAVDGLRADLLDRYDAAFTGGFQRLRDEGRRFTSAWVDHAITVSHAGHVTLATGLVPARHGIVDAAYYVPEGDGRVLVDAVADTTESILGMPGRNGVSPRHVLADGICEWTLRADTTARSLSVGSGNVSSLLYAFHTPANVYWYRGGRYVTSTYYRSSYPSWVAQFNTEALPGFKDASTVWTNSVPDTLRELSRADSAAFEGDHVHTRFPHRFEAELARFIARNRQAALSTWLGWTPSLDDATLALAARGVDAMDLGKRDATDCLTVVLSMVDSNSHYYGPLSMETFDTLVRLDQALGTFFDFLDTTVGKGRYVVALSADHGFPEVPEYRHETGRTGIRIGENEIEDFLADVRNAIDSTATPADVARRVADVARRRAYVADAYTTSELEAGETSDDPYVRLYRNSFRPDRIPRLPLFSLNTFESPIGEAGVMLRLVEGAIIDLDASTHGSPYPYDRHVPLVFMGPGVDPGADDGMVLTVDVAPTLAHLGGIPLPSGLDGHVVATDAAK